MNSLAALFFMLALFCFIQARMATGVGRHRIRTTVLYLLCLAAAVCGLAAKQTVAVLPLVLLLYEWFFFQNMDRAWLKKQLPWMGLTILIVIALIFLYMDGNPLAKLQETYGNKPFTPGQRLLTEARVVIFYLSLLFFPYPDRLNLVYDFPLSDTPINPLTTLPALAAILMLFVAALYAAKKHRLFSFAVLWFLITLVIESSIIGLELIYEHRTYLPSIFPMIGMTVLIFRYLRPRFLAVLTLCFLIGISGFWTYGRNSVWQNKLDLWRDNVAKSPEIATPYVKLSAALMDIGEDDAAEKRCRRALRIEPENAGAYNLLGLMLLRQGRPDEAVGYLRQAVRLAPDDLQFYHNLGVALAESGQTKSAMGIFTQIIDRFPYSPKTFYHLARIHAQRNEFDQAAALYKKAITYQPDYVMAYNDLGLVLLMQNRISEAVSAFEKAVALNPDYTGAHLNLAQVLKRRAPQQALAHARRAAVLTPADPRPYVLAGEILATLDKTGQALANYQKAVLLRPDNPQLFYRIARLHARRNEADKAVTALKQAVENGFNDRCLLISDKGLENIRQTEYYQSLVSGPVSADGIDRQQ